MRPLASLALFLCMLATAAAVSGQDPKELAALYTQAWDALYNHGDPAPYSKLVDPKDLQEFKDEVIKAYGIADNLLKLKGSASSVATTTFSSIDEIKAATPEEVFIKIRKRSVGPPNPPKRFALLMFSNPTYFYSFSHEGMTFIVFSAIRGGNTDNKVYSTMECTGGKFRLDPMAFFPLEDEINRNLTDLGELPSPMAAQKSIPSPTPVPP